jgi:putative DNA primase/helicase
MKGGVHVVGRKAVAEALVRFLRFKPKQEIIRIPRVGWAQVGSHWIFVRPDEVIAPIGIPQESRTTYVLDAAATRHGLHVAGTAGGRATEIAAPLEGNSNIALSFATFFAAPMLAFANEPGGGNHLYGRSTIGKTLASDLGQSICGWPHETADDAFGVSWGGTEAGFDALAQAHTDLGLSLDEITLAVLRTAEQVVYKVASGTKGPRATSTGDLRETPHASVLVLSTGEKSLAQFIGPSLQEGARKRLVDVPAEIQPGSAFETISSEQIHIVGSRLFDAMKRQHGAVGRDWQRYLVNLGPDRIKADLDRHREAFRTLSEVITVIEKAHPQVRAVVNRFALYAAALHMAIEAGLLPWTIENADAGIIACMQRWVAQRGNVDTAGEIVRAAHQIGLDLVADLDRFIAIHKVGKAWTPFAEADAVKQETAKDFDGYVKPDRILVRPEAWRRYCNGVDPSELARQFQQRGVLIADGEGVSKAEQVIGKLDRFYVLLRGPLTALQPYSKSEAPENSDQKSM